jgi:serine/threonine-protein kinase ATR
MNVPNDLAKVPLSKELRRFKRLLSSGSLIAAPNSTLVYRPEIKEEYDYILGIYFCIFRVFLILILGFEDQCVTLPSLQRPKKLRISFNNSKSMNVLLKPKDDLRRDSRFMELCYFLNRNFSKNRLKYDVKTFAVTPLNDECGIIEWVENTAGLRNVLIKTYKKVNISVQRRDMKDIIEMKIDEYEKFTKFLLPRFPPILMRWFFEKFPSLDRWNAAVKDYSHSMAVMSMIGYIMG